MYKIPAPVRVLLTGFILCLSFASWAQKKNYNSLLWEITGNGLSRPSYLFGTMHISNKMVFHLSDSFYMGIRNSDVVAIELNPEQWQTEIPRMNRQGNLIRYYSSFYYPDYLKEQTFTEDGFLSGLQACLRFEPELNDALLYRNESRLDNFQEDTYLDLYIYQTGRKLGKMAAGVETYSGSQRMMIEAMVDAALEKEKKRPQMESTGYFDINQLLQDAYRRGDLDMLDSLNALSGSARSFTEKFLYKRNEMQAASMDSIMKKHSLFVGVGAAHLPGTRGVIELLRQKGYKLRPVFMQDRDAQQKKYIDSLTVPVSFSVQYAADSSFSVAVPGRLNEVDNGYADVRHYADMGNGAYYLISRVRINRLFNGFSDQKIQRMIDSMLYENIPGTILSSTALSRSGYKGLDIVNRTRKGDVQRYQLWITPSELLIFKMGGKGNYVQGKEAETFFSSISFREAGAAKSWQPFTPASGGFTVRMPDAPRLSYKASGNDRLPEWKYEATDPATGEQYAVYRKGIYSFSFIGADTFDLGLMAESFGSSDQWEKKRSVRLLKEHGRAVKELELTAKNGDRVRARAVMFGPQYYLLIHRGKGKTLSEDREFFSSFVFSPFNYPAALPYTDTMTHFSTRTAVRPEFDRDMVEMLQYAKQSEALIRKNVRFYSNNPETRSANFVSEETSEVIVVNSYEYPRYTHIRDSAGFWQEQFIFDSTLVLHRCIPQQRGSGARGWLLEWSDTGSTRLIRRLVLVQGMNMAVASTVVDSTLPESAFVRNFFDSFDMHGVPQGSSLYTPKHELFFRDYYSKDSVTSNKAKLALSYVYYGKEGYPAIVKAIAGLRAKDADYYDLKNKFIAELGFIRDSTVVNDVAATLRKLYLDAGDTTLFQNSILRALARLRTPSATSVLKELVLQDPPAFDEQYAYGELFSDYYDSLRLAAPLYPELLNLSTIEDFKDPVRDLLAASVDSGYIKPDVYEDNIGNIYFDAKIALKKMRNADERSYGQDADQEETYTYRTVAPRYGGNTTMNRYISLLAPFYNKNPNLPKFFAQLLASSDMSVKAGAGLAMLRYGHPVPDSLWQGIASDPANRVPLWIKLKSAGRTELFPGKYRTGESLAAGLLYQSLDKRLDSLVLLEKRSGIFGDPATTTYIYKYKLKKEDGWQLAFSSALEPKGRQAEIVYTGYNLAGGRVPVSREEAKEAITQGLKRLAITAQPSGSQFYANTDGGVPEPAMEAED